MMEFFSEKYFRIAQKTPSMIFDKVLNMSMVTKENFWKKFKGFFIASLK